VPKDGVVFDPFAGSASTLVAAKSLGLRYYGCEIDEENWKIGQGRLENMI
jgi:DNA modification methylase